jgi:hypothetical protein
VKPVLASIGSLNFQKKNNKKNKSKIRCETGSRRYREFKFSKKIRKSGVKPVLASIGSLNLKKKNNKKKNRKSGVKPVLGAIGSLNFQKKIENPV